MVLSDFSIRRPVVAIVASLLLVVFGLYAATQLPVRETPNIDVPNINVSVNYPGASAEVVESKEIKLLEDQISGIAGIKSIQAGSRDGGGFIMYRSMKAAISKTPRMMCAIRSAALFRVCRRTLCHR